MGDRNVNVVLRAPGRLSYGCTNLLLAWPHGGTRLGFVADVKLRLRREDFAVEDEAFGFEIIEKVQGGENAGLGAVLNVWDSDAIGLVFPNASVGAVTQERVVEAPGANVAGVLRSARGVVLVFTPEGCTHAKSATAPDARVPFIVFYRALPDVEGSADVALRRDQDFGVPVIFDGIRDTSGRLYKWGRRADITL